MRGHSHGSARVSCDAPAVGKLQIELTLGTRKFQASILDLSIGLAGGGVLDGGDSGAITTTKVVQTIEASVHRLGHL